LLQDIGSSPTVHSVHEEDLDLTKLVGNLRHSQGAIHTIENGTAVRRSYQELHRHCAAAIEILRGWGVAPGVRVGIFAPNSYFWLVYDLALLEIGAVSVAFTDDFKDSLGDETLKKYGVPILLTTKDFRSRFSSLGARVIYIDDINQNFSLLSLPSLGPDRFEQDTLGHVFSSGSSGGLKGLIISRRGVGATLPPLLRAVGFKTSDRLLLFLPMSNFQQRFLCYGALWHDFDIILVDAAHLFKAMEQLHPTILLAPPIFYQMVHAEFHRQSRWKKSALLTVAAVLTLAPSQNLRQALARQVLGGFYRQFGKRIRLLVTGMAPVRPEIGRFFHHMALPLAEAYGMVEAGVIAYRPGTLLDFTSVGKPLPDVRLSFSGDGEILVARKHTVASGYFQCAEGEDQKTFVAPGVIATGDIGTLNDKGRLILLGRKKEVIVTPSGHKIHPEVMEKELDAHPEICNSVVFLGQKSDLRCIVSLIEPDNEDAKLRVKRFLMNHGKIRNLSSLVTVVFTESPFTRENGMLRPNMKIDRKRIIERYDAA
jgi:long-subunit acyl-CoA synthetase (AMP-forming)